MIFSFLLCCLFIGPLAAAAELKVAAASDLQFAFPELRAAYERSHPGDTLAPTFGASGKLRAQIESGAPFGLFLSADAEQPATLRRAGKVSAEPFAFARGHLALLVRKESQLALDGKLRCLLAPEVRRVAVGHPVHAPFGRIARQALERAKIYGELSPKLAMGESISQAAQFVESRAADVAIVARAVAEAGAVRGWGRSEPVAPELYEPLTLTGLVLPGAQAAIAGRLKAFLLSEEGRGILRRHGQEPL